MRVLQVLPSLSQNGGVEKGVVRLAAMAPNNIWVASAGGQLADDIKNHITLPLHTKNPLTILKNASRLADAIQEHNIQLVHVRSRAPAWSVRLACKKTNTPWIATYHGLYNSTNMIKSYYNRIMTRGNTVIAISNWVHQHIKKHYPTAHITPLYEGIDTTEFKPSLVHTLREPWRTQHHIAPQAKVILLPGRLTRWKGQHVLLKAAQQLDESFHIVLIGDAHSPTYRNELEQLNQHTLCTVHMLDACSDIRSAYAGADVVVSCSTDPEAFGRITAEALAMERPYIGTNHGGSVELTKNGTFGWLIEPGSPDALAKAIYETCTHTTGEQTFENEPQEKAIYEKVLCKETDEGIANGESSGSESSNALPITPSPHGAHLYIHQNYNEHVMFEQTLKLYSQYIKQPNDTK